MNIQEALQAAYGAAKSYPELAARLLELGISSYTVDTASGIILYRFPDGAHVLHHDAHAGRTVNAVFNEAATIQAVRDSQAGKIDYPGFMQAIADAGVYLYEATLAGNNKRVTYIGIGGMYEETIPTVPE